MSRENPIGLPKAKKKIRRKHTMKSEDTNRIVEKIVEALGKGEIPWRKPWRSCAAHNAISGSEYRGVNALVLNLASHYPDPRFLTYKQAAALGAQVRKGEKGWPVIFYSTIKKSGESEGGNGETSGKAKTFRFMKHYTVFNASQCDGMPHGMKRRRAYRANRGSGRHNQTHAARA
jgi:antirestriction protein ArdC